MFPVIHVVVWICEDCKTIVVLVLDHTMLRPSVFIFFIETSVKNLYSSMFSCNRKMKDSKKVLVVSLFCVVSLSMRSVS